MNDRLVLFCVTLCLPHLKFFLSNNFCFGYHFTINLILAHTGVRLPTTTPTPTQEPTTTVITTSLPTIPTHQVPEKPENVVARSLSDTEIELSWSPPTVTFGEIVEYSCFYYEMDKEGKNFFL